MLKPKPAAIERYHYQKGVSRKSRRSLMSTVALAIAGFFVLAITSSISTPDPRAGIHRQDNIAFADNSGMSFMSDTLSARELNRDETLEELIKEYIATLPQDQKWSVYVQDLQSNTYIDVNAEEVMNSASLYKLFLLPALESKVAAEKWDSWGLTRCVDLMLRESDNPCAVQIGSMVGWDYADKFTANLGFSQTKMPSYYQKTSASDVAKLLIKLQKGQLLTDQARYKIFEALYGQKFREGIPAGCTDCEVANKTGDLAGQVAHDAAVVSHGDNQYVIVVMSEKGNSAQIANIAKIVDSYLYP